MATGFTSVNKGRSPLVALPTSTLSESTMPVCIAEKPAKEKRKAPSAANPEQMELYIADLRREIALNGLDVPPGITDENDVIESLRANGVPAAHSKVGTRWTASELDFIQATMDWPHVKLAAYLGRTCQASRLGRTKALKRQRQLARSRTTAHSVSPVASSSHSVPPVASSSHSNTASASVPTLTPANSSGSDTEDAPTPYVTSTGGVYIVTDQLLPSLSTWDQLERPVGDDHQSPRVKKLLHRLEETRKSLPEGCLALWRPAASNVDVAALQRVGTQASKDVRGMQALIDTAELSGGESSFAARSISSPLGPTPRI